MIDWHRVAVAVWIAILIGLACIATDAAADAGERFPWEPYSHQAPLANASWQHHGGPEACFFLIERKRPIPLGCTLLDRPRRSIR